MKKNQIKQNSRPCNNVDKEKMIKKIRSPEGQLSYEKYKSEILTFNYRQKIRCFLFIIRFYFQSQTLSKYFKVLQCYYQNKQKISHFHIQTNSTNQNSTILSNGYNLSTTQTFIYSNGIKKGIQTNSMEQKTICQKNELMNSLTIGNSIQKCEQTINSTKGFNIEYIEKCNTIVQEQLLPDSIDPSKPFLNITKTDQCSRLYEQNIQIDIGIVTLSENSQNIGKANKTLTQIQLDTNLQRELCQSNYSSDIQTLNKSDIQILNHTQQFEKITTNKKKLEQCTNQQDIQQATQLASFKIENEAWIEETIIFDEELERKKQLENSEYIIQTLKSLQELSQSFNNLEKYIEHVQVVPFSNGIILQAWIILYVLINQ